MPKDFIALVWLIVSIIPATAIAFVKRFTGGKAIKTKLVAEWIVDNTFALFDEDETPTPAPRKPRSRKKP